MRRLCDTLLDVKNATPPLPNPISAPPSCPARIAPSWRAAPPYQFSRVTSVPTDTLQASTGTPAARCGLVRSAFRPSDDATTFQFLVCRHCGWPGRGVLWEPWFSEWERGRAQLFARSHNYSAHPRGAEEHAAHTRGTSPAPSCSLLPRRAADSTPEARVSA